jgi:hypothetical protein
MSSPSVAMKWRRAARALAMPAAAAALLLSPGAGASEQAIWELGTLTCSLTPEAKQSPSEPGQGRAALCQFRPRDRGPEETYVGTFQFIGPEKAIGASRTIMLVVKAPVAKQIGVALLAQGYSADASTGVGKQAPLVGSKDSSVVLQLASDRVDSPSMALGQSLPATIILAELKLAATPA